MLLPMHRRAERHDAGPVGLSCAGLYWGIDVLTAARVHSAMQAPRHGAGVACIERGRMHAHLKRPAAHSCCGHVTGPAPQGRPPGCTRRARAVILSPVSPCGANYYRNRVQLNMRHDIVSWIIASTVTRLRGSVWQCGRGRGAKMRVDTTGRVNLSQGGAQLHGAQLTLRPDQGEFTRVVLSAISPPATRPRQCHALACTRFL